MQHRNVSTTLWLRYYLAWYLDADGVTLTPNRNVSVQNITKSFHQVWLNKQAVAHGTILHKAQCQLAGPIKLVPICPSIVFHHYISWPFDMI